MTVAIHVKIIGLVHGVSYRASMAQIATEVGVKGWVRNVPDGSVEAFLEGDEKNLKRILVCDWLGLSRGRVDWGEVEDATPGDQGDIRFYV